MAYISSLGHLYNTAMVYEIMKHTDVMHTNKFPPSSTTMPVIENGCGHTAIKSKETNRLHAVV